MGPRAKIARANEHAAALEAQVQAFFATGPYEVTSQIVPENGDQVWIVTRCDDVPGAIAVVAGDAIHNARSALDLMFGQLVGAAGHSPEQSDVFPISRSQSEFEDKAIPKIKRRVAADILQAIADLRPYQGGDDWLWRLHRLDIIDKHRLLLTTGSYNQSVKLPMPDLRPDQAPFFSAEQLAASNQEFRETMPFFTAKPLPAVKIGTQLIRLTAEQLAEPHNDPEFRIQLSLAEPDVIEDEPITAVVAEAVHAADQVVEALAERL